MDVKLESLFAVKCILDENNWSSYKYHAETFAMKIEADDIIDGKEVEPTCEESSTNAEKIAQYEASLKLSEDKSRKMYFYLRSVVILAPNSITESRFGSPFRLCHLHSAFLHPLIHSVNLNSNQVINLISLSFHSILNRLWVREFPHISSICVREWM